MFDDESWMVSFYDQRDVDWAEKESPDLIEFYEDKIGVGAEIKTSGRTPNDYERFAELVANVFHDLHQSFEIKVYSGSFSL